MQRVVGCEEQLAFEEGEVQADYTCDQASATKDDYVMQWLACSEEEASTHQTTITVTDSDDEDSIVSNGSSTTRRRRCVAPPMTLDAAAPKLRR